MQLVIELHVDQRCSIAWRELAIIINNTLNLTQLSDYNLSNMVKNAATGPFGGKNKKNRLKYHTWLALQAQTLN